VKRKGPCIVFLVLLSLILVTAWFQTQKSASVVSLPANADQARGTGSQTEQPQYMAVTVLPPAQKLASAPKKLTSLKKRTPAQDKTIAKGEPAKSVGKHEGDGNGEYPNFYAEYELGINDYLEFMRERGAKVLIYDLGTNTPVCEVEASGKLQETASLDAYSGNTRRITDDYPGAEKLLKRVEKQFGRAGSYEILLLLPESLVSALNEHVISIVTSSGVNMSDVSTVFLRYRGSRSSLTVQVERVSGKMGSRTIGKAFRL